MTKQRSGVRRIVESRELKSGGFVATLNPEGVELKPKRTRKLDSAVFVTWDQIYRWALWPPLPKRRRRKGRR